MRRNGVPARGRRTATLLAATLVAGAAGHTAGGGAWTGSSIAVVAALLLLPTWLATARELRLPTIVGLLSVGQAATHATLTLLASHTHDSIVPTGPMIAAHVVATGFLAWWIRRGERALWARLRRVLLLVTQPAPSPAVRSLPVAGSAAFAQTALLRHCLISRGPPARG